MNAPVVVASAGEARSARSESRSPALAARDSAGGVRALFVLASLSVGGSETKIVRVANALLRRGVQTGVAYLNGPDDLLKSLDPDVPRWHLQRRGKFSFTALRSLRQLILEERPDVVLSVNLYPALYVSLVAMGMGRRPRIAALINTTDFPPGHRWRAAFYRPVLRRFDLTVFGCELQRSAWLMRLNRARARSAVIYNGVDAEHFVSHGRDAKHEERKRFGIAPQRFVVGAVGRLAPEKNHAVLIDALAQLRGEGIDAHLLLVGEGRMRNEIERRVGERGLQSHVTLTGVQADVRSALSAMDVFVLPSTSVETFSNAALEAMAMRKLVILSRIGGAAEMVRDGVEGFIVEPAKLSRDLAPLLMQLYSDAPLRERMGSAARARIVRDFSMQRMVEDYASLIDVNAGAGAAVRRSP